MCILSVRLADQVVQYCKPITCMFVNTEQPEIKNNFMYKVLKLLYLVKLAEKYNVLMCSFSY